MNGTEQSVDPARCAEADCGDRRRCIACRSLRAQVSDGMHLLKMIWLMGRTIPLRELSQLAAARADCTDSGLTVTPERDGTTGLSFIYADVDTPPNATPCPAFFDA